MTSNIASENEEALSIMVHEIAHQWFGNMVTLDWWSHIWLNEAFPTYLMSHIGDKVSIRGTLKRYGMYHSYTIVLPLLAFN